MVVILFDRLSSTSESRLSDIISINVQRKVAEGGAVADSFLWVVDSKLEAGFVVVRVVSDYALAYFVSVVETVQQVGSKVGRGRVGSNGVAVPTESS